MKSVLVILSAILLPILIPASSFSQGKCISGKCTKGFGTLLLKSGLKQEGYFDSKGLARGWIKIEHSNGDLELAQSWDGKRKGIRLYYLDSGTISMFFINEFAQFNKRYDFKPDEDKVILWIEDRNGENLESRYLYDEEKYIAQFVLELNEEFVQSGKTNYGWFDINLDEAELVYNKMWGANIWQYHISIFDLTLSARNHPEGNPGGDVYSIMCNKGSDHKCIEHYREKNNRLVKNAEYGSFQLFGPRHIDNDEWVTPLREAKKAARSAN